MSITTDNTPGNNFAQEILRAFFIDHLNIIYCGKSHIAERLPEIAEQAAFKDLRLAITETQEDIEKQIARMDRIYILLDARHSVENCDNFIEMIEKAFEAIHTQSTNTTLRDLSILFYLQNIESMCVSSFRVLQIAATRFKSEQISQLLKENLDEAKEDLALLAIIMAKYLKK